MHAVMFTAPWCAACPAAKKLVAEYVRNNPQHIVDIVDMQLNASVATKFAVKSLPTLVSADGNKRLAGNFTAKAVADFFAEA